MKNLIVVLLICIVSSSLFSQTFVQTKHDVKYVGNSKFVPTGTMYAEKDLGKKFGVSTFSLVTNDWAEILIGAYYRLDTNLTIGIQAGMETTDPYWRFGSSLSYMKNNNTVMLLVEKGYGDENYWYSISYQNTNHKFVWGLMGQRFYGWGPEIGFQFGKSIITVAPLYDFEVKQFQPTIFWGWFI